MHPAETLLKTLGHHTTTFQTFPEANNARGAPTILHGTHFMHAPTLERLNKQGHGIFFMVNKGDQKGRRAENVQSITSHFVDLDGTPLYDTWPLPPTAITESSPGKYHAYWRTTNAPLNTFQHTQKHIAVLLAGDEKCSDLPRVLRLPGYQHQKGTPFTTRILHADPTATYEHAVILEAFAVPTPPPERPPRPPLPPSVQAYIDRHQKRGAPKRTLDTAANRVATAREGDRNHTLYKVASALAAEIRNGKTNQTEAEERLYHAAIASGLNERETLATIKSAMRHAQ